jgi:hypothetical protein
MELRRHPFITRVDSTCDDIIRNELVNEISLIKAFGKQLKREPEVTTKHGKLKTARKSKLRTMFVDDLAALLSFDEVFHHEFLIDYTHINFSFNVIRLLYRKKF